jgi:hypothetical protein
MSYWLQKPPSGAALDLARARGLSLTNLWLSTEPGGGTIFDCLGAASGLLHSGAWLGASAFGNALTFGAAGQCAVCPSIPMGGSFTMFWYGVLYSNTVSNFFRGLLVKDQNGGDQAGDCSLRLSAPGGSMTGAGQISFQLISTSTDDDGNLNENVNVVSGSAAPLNVPILALGTYFAPTQLMSLYVNGSLKATATLGQPIAGSSNLIEHGASNGAESTRSLAGAEIMSGISSLRAWTAAEAASFDPLSLFLPPAGRKALISLRPSGAPFLFDSEMTGFGQQMGL